MISFDRYMALAQPFSRRHSQAAAHVNTRSSIASMGGPIKRKTLKQAGRRIFLVWSIALGTYEVCVIFASPCSSYNVVIHCQYCTKIKRTKEYDG